MTTHSVPCILVVDDEEQIRSALHTVLSARSYEVVLGADGKEALDLARQHQPDLVVLDLAMPEMNGLQVCKQLRTWTAIPILVLSVRGSEADKILALDLGADDFLTKPFATGELLARIRALLRRAGAGQGAASDPVIRVGPLAIDTVKRRVLRDDVELRLTRTEFDILSAWPSMPTASPLPGHHGTTSGEPRAPATSRPFASTSGTCARR